MNGFSTAARVALALVILALATLPAAAQFEFLEVKIVDEGGQPVTDAELEVSLSGTEFPMPTDDKGVLSLNVPEGGDSATRFIIKHEGHVRVGVSWEPGDTVPEQLTIQLEKAVPIGGIVQDEDGNPIEGVTVEGAVIVNSRADYLPGKGEVAPFLYGELARTGPDGRWQTNSAPEKSVALQLKFSHPDYKSDGGYGPRGGTWEELRSLEKIVVLEKGLELRGTITDPSGNPVTNAKVGFGRGRYYSNYQVVQTDAAGNYSLKNLGEAPDMLTVSSPDWAPDMRSVTPAKNGPPEDFRLGPPSTVRLRVVDRDGQPIEGVTIVPEEWRSFETLEDPFGRKKTNAEGIWEWNSAPPDEVRYSIFKPDMFGVPEWQARFSASPDIQDVTMLPAPVVLGTVVDKGTGKPIEKFRHTEGTWWEPSYESPVLQTGHWQVGSEGKFRFAMESGCVKFMVRVEADGYRPVESRAIMPEEREVALTFEMEPGTGPTGIVKLPDGTPAEGVKVAMATTKQQVLIYNGEMQPDFAAGESVTDAEGRFEMPFPESDFAIVCNGDAGWAVVYADQGTTSVEATLEPWGRVEGVALRGDQPLQNEQITVYRNQANGINAPRVYFQSYVQTDSQGRFVLDHLQSGETTIARSIHYAQRGQTGSSVYTHNTTVDVKPAETITVQIGGTGRNVTGRLTAPAEHRDLVDWRLGAVSLTESRVPSGPAGFFYQLGQAIGQATSLGGSKPAPRRRGNSTYASAIDEEGRYQIYDVPPGDYQLRLTLYPKDYGEGQQWNDLGTLTVPVTIPADGEGPVDLGQHEITIISR